MKKINKLSDYDIEAEKTAIYKQKVIYPSVGLVGEAGEVADKVKKIMRDSNENPTDDDKRGVLLELGDVMWYCSALIRDYNMKLSCTEDIINKCGFRSFYQRIKVMDVYELSVYLSKECSSVSMTALETSGLTEAVAIQTFIADGVTRVIAVVDLLAKKYGYNLSDVCTMNIEKLASRAERNKINGSGDER